MPAVQLAIPIAIEIYVFLLVLEGHTKYECFESSWATARYILQQITIMFLLFLGVIQLDIFKSKVDDKTLTNVNYFSPDLIETLEYLAIYLMCFTVAYEAFEVIRKYMEDLVVAYKRGKAEGKGFFQIFFSNESDTLLIENLIG
jgi:hypothetical protein